MVLYKNRLQLKSYLQTVTDPETELFRLLNEVNNSISDLRMQQELLQKELISLYLGSGTSLKSGSLSSNQKTSEVAKSGAPIATKLHKSCQCEECTPQALPNGL
jgi:hypothetical protein